MNDETNERLEGRMELYALLERGLENVRQGHGKPAEMVFDKIMEDLKQGTDEVIP